MITALLRGATVAAALGFAPVVALAADGAPDLTGKWTGQTHSIVAGTGGHWPDSAGTFDKPALHEKDLVFDVTGQDGRRFWGTTSIAGGVPEPFIGQVTPDGTRLVLADTDGYWEGPLTGDVFSFCYTHAGGPSSSSVVSCTEVTHQK